jgi:plasmid stabilization system protein ParE
MSLPVRLQRAAQAEYDEAVDWYEARRSGLGVRFLGALQETIEAIGEQPDRFPEVEVGVREAMVSSWPYCVYYQVRSDHVMVIAVFHSSRDPAVWQWRRDHE